MDGVRPHTFEGPLVRRLIDQGIRDPRVLAAFSRVPRHFFVPDEARRESEADRPLDIGHGQTISQPFIVAAMTEALQLTGRERVLEVGSVAGATFSAAAVAAGLAHEVVEVEDWCAGLARRQQWLEACGEAVWPDGTVHEEADGFLRLSDGTGTQKTYAYYLVDHLRWREREGLTRGGRREPAGLFPTDLGGDGRTVSPE